jgi:hypothetical protein
MTKIYCDQYCGTAIHFVDGRPYNDRDNKPHICYITTRVREFEGYFNMIQIKRVREKLLAIEQLTINLSAEIAGLSRTLDWQEEQNKPLAEAFEKRKQEGRARNYSPHE